MNQKTIVNLLEYYRLTREVTDIIKLEQEKELLQSTAINFKHLLSIIESTEESNDALATNKAEFQKHLESLTKHKLDLDAKITSLTIELESNKGSKMDKASLDKEIHGLKIQLNKLNKQLIETNLEKERMKEAAKRHRALLESKLEATRRTIPKASAPIQLSSGPKSTASNDKITTQTLTLSDNLSKSPFAEEVQNRGTLNLTTPVVVKNKLLSTSTPGDTSTFSKDIPELTNTAKKRSNLNELFKHSELPVTKKKGSLFDMDNDDDLDDLFDRSITKISKDQANKKRLITKSTVEHDEKEESSKGAPSIKMIKNLHAARIVSPLKPRTEHQSAFKFSLK